MKLNKTTQIANTPKPPYVCAVFTSIRSDVEDGYDEMDELTFKEIETIEGYLGCESFRDENGYLNGKLILIYFFATFLTKKTLSPYWSKF